MISRITPRSNLSDMYVGEAYSYEIDITKRLKTRIVDSFTYKVYDSSGLDVTDSLGGGSLISENVIIFGIKATSVGTFDLVFAIMCVETLPDSTAYDFHVNMTVRVS